MKRYMLDTNMVSHLIKAHPAVCSRVVVVPITSLCISVITEAELQFGLAKRPDAKRLHFAVQEFLRRVDVLPWDRTISQHYGKVRVDLEPQGKSLAPLDLLIAAHAMSEGVVLVTNDSAFRQITELTIEDWTD